MSNPMIALAIDTETTGNMPDEDGVCQVGAVAMSETGDIQTILSTFCRPSVPIKAEARAVHGITDAQLEWAPDEYTALQTLVAEIAYLEKQGFDIIPGAHNGERFDFPIINRILGAESPFPDMYRFDTLVMGRRWFPDGSHKLGEFYEWYIEAEQLQAHDAVADCWMVCRLLHKMLTQKNKSLLWAAKWIEKPYRYEFMPFGKHKGMAMEEVPSTYLGWWKRNSKMADRDMDFTVAAVEREMAEARKLKGIAQ